MSNQKQKRLRIKFSDNTNEKTEDDRFIAVAQYDEHLDLAKYGFVGDEISASGNTITEAYSNLKVKIDAALEKAGKEGLEIKLILINHFGQFGDEIKKLMQ